jgi:hypothetical protein
MNHLDLEKEWWEDEDNWDGAKWMTERARKYHLEQIFKLECKQTEKE